MGSKKQTTTEKYEVPSWLEEGSKQAVGLGQKIATQEYTPYTKQRVANLSANEQQAGTMAATGGAQSRSYLEQAAKKAEGVKSLEGADLSGYTNPYLESVLNPALRDVGRAYETSATQLKNSAAKVGAFGGDRQAIAESQLNKNYMENISDLSAKERSNAFLTAQQAFASDQDRQLRVADTLRATGGDLSRMDSQQIQDLMLTGGTKRILEQANLDFDYQQFTENRDWDMRDLSGLIASLNVPHGSTTTKTQKTGGSAWGTILGVVGTAVGAYYGGAQGAQAGGAIGSSVGGAIDNG